MIVTFLNTKRQKAYGLNCLYTALLSAEKTKKEGVPLVEVIGRNQFPHASHRCRTVFNHNLKSDPMNQDVTAKIVHSVLPLIREGKR